MIKFKLQNEAKIVTKWKKNQLQTSAKAWQLQTISQNNYRFAVKERKLSMLETQFYMNGFFFWF